MKPMPAKKKASDVRGMHLGIRLTAKERKRLRDVAKKFPAMPESAVARIALLAGLESIEREGVSVSVASEHADRRKTWAATATRWTGAPGAYVRARHAEHLPTKRPSELQKYADRIGLVLGDAAQKDCVRVKLIDVDLPETLVVHVDALDAP